MSVNIKDMKMPKNCDCCPLRAIAIARCQITMKSTSHHPTGKKMDETKRPDWCPLQEVKDVFD